MSRMHRDHRGYVSWSGRLRPLVWFLCLLLLLTCSAVLVQELPAFAASVGTSGGDGLQIPELAGLPGSAESDLEDDVLETTKVQDPRFVRRPREAVSGPGLSQAEALAADLFVASLVQTIDTSLWSPPSPDPTGVTYITSSNTLMLSDSEVDETLLWAGANVFEFTLSGTLTDTFSIMSFSDEPTGICFNQDNGHLFFTDDELDRVFELNPGPDGLFATSDDVVTWFSGRPFGSRDPEGVACSAELGMLFIADGVDAEIYKVTPGANLLFDGIPPDGDDEVTSFDTASFGMTGLEDVAYNSENGLLYILGIPRRRIAVSTTDGVLVRMIDISAANPDWPEGLTVAPGSLDPAATHIYIADKGEDNDTNPGENDGKVYEMTLPPTVPDLTVVKSAEPPSALVGDTITYTLSFSNIAEGTASGVVLTDIIPTGVTVESVVNSGATITDTGLDPGYVWEVEELAPAEGGIITIVGSLDPGLLCWQTIDNEATITNTTGDSNPENDSNGASIIVGGGVTVNPTSNTDSGDPGTDVVHTLHVQNTGDCTDSFSLTLSGNAWSVSGQATVGPLGPGEVADVPLTVSVPADALCGDSDAVSVTITSQGDGLSSASSVLTTEANPVYGMTLTPASDDASGDPGAGVPYTLRVTNEGNCADTFSRAVSGNVWDVDGPTTVGPLDPGVGADVEVVVGVPTDATCGTSDVATVTFTSQGDGTISDSSILTTAANTVYDMRVTPASRSSSGNPGTDVPYVLTVANEGNCTDTYIRSVSGNAWPVTAPTQAGPLEPGARQVVGITVKVPADAVCGDSDTASITFTSQGDGTTSDTSQLNTAANTVYEVTVTPTSDAGSADPGGSVPYTLQVTNAGNCTDSFSPSVSGNAWNLIGLSPVGPLAPGAGAEVNVSVEVPEDAQCGDDIATVTFTSQGDGTSSGASVLTTSANAVYGVTVSPTSDAGSGDPGADVPYTLRVTNEGNCTDTFDRSASGNTWNVTGPSTVGPLAAGAWIDVDVSVEVPEDAECGDSDIASVAFTSQGDGTTSAASSLTTTANAVYDVTVTPASDAGSGDPGSGVPYTLQVTNAGNCTDTFDRSASGNTWNVTGPSTVGPLAPGEQTDVDVTVEVPEDAECGDDVATVTFTSQGDDAISGASVLTTSANAVYGVTVSPTSDAGSGDPGADVPYTLRVTNEGNCTDTFDRSASGNTWNVTGPSTVGPLAPGAGTDVDVTVEVPEDAECGDNDVASVAFTSQGDGITSAASSLTTTANAVYDVTISPTSDADSGDPGTGVTYTLQVTNAGNCTDTYDRLVSGNLWSTVAPPSVGPLAPGLATSAEVTVTVPACTAGGVSDQSVLTFVSQGDSTVTGAASLQTTANGVAPVAQSNEYSTQEDTSLVVGAPGVLGNDTDINCDALSVSLQSPPSDGTILLAPSGAFTYTPDANFYGIDSFSYYAHDQVFTDTATVTLTITSGGDDPIVDAGDDQTVDEGEDVQFSGGFVDPARRVQAAEEAIHWDFGDGTTALGTLTPVHVFRDNGAYTVTLTITDTQGDVGQDALQVMVLNVAPTVDAGPDMNTTPGKAVSFTGAFDDPGLDDEHTIAWDLGDGTLMMDTLSFSHAYDYAGVYTVTLTVTDDDGGVGTDTALVDVKHLVYLPIITRASQP